MMGEVVAGAGLGYAIDRFANNDEFSEASGLKGAALGVASTVGGSVLAGWTGRRSMKILGGTAIYVAGKKITKETAGEPDNYMKHAIEGAILSVTASATGRMIDGFMYGGNDGTSMLDYTRGQAP